MSSPSRSPLGHRPTARKAPMGGRTPWYGLATLCAPGLPAHAAEAVQAVQGAVTWPLAAAALLAVGGAAFAAGSLWAQRRERQALRQARRQVQVWSQILETWSWQTDAAHRLRGMRPPWGAPESAWRAASGADNGDEPFWQRFAGGAAGDALRTRMDAHAEIVDVELEQPGSSAAIRWRLRGVPCFADDGAFEGYQGTARVADTRAGELPGGAELVQALLDGLAAPALVVHVDQEAWTLTALNGAARERFAIPAPDLPDWQDALSSLPAAIRPALASLQPGQTLEVEGWQLRHSGDAGRGNVVLRAIAPADPAATDLQGEQAALSFTVSHDLRAPIRVVEGFTRILKEDYGQQIDRVGNDHLDRVLGAAARMNHMIDALLMLARLSTQPLVRQPVNLSQLAEYVADELRRAAPERAVQVQLEPGLTVQGDPTLLRLVLENLLGNAWKYSARVDPARIAFGCEPHEGSRAFYVRDNGAGFDMRGADRLFGLFQRLHSASDFSGTGVGLASVKRIVLRHGGSIWAESEPGHGATFRFTLRE